MLFATAELAPLARVGGLAAASAGIVAEMRRQGVDVNLVVPDYFGTPLEDEVVMPITTMPAWAQPAYARRGRLDGIGQITLVDTLGVRKPHPYNDEYGNGWFDNDARFLGFAAAVAAICAATQPDILHLNDWHTSSAPAFLWPTPPVVLTIHTLGYQGRTNRGWLNGFWHFRERYYHDDACNPLAGGIRSADLVVSVSPHYADEIRQPRMGFGLDGLLRDKGERLVGILNGIDTVEWNPLQDAHLPQTYGQATLSRKAASRAELFHRFGLSDTSGPLFVMVTRLVHQKGVDLVLPLVGELEAMGARLAVLGSGDRHLADALEAAAAHLPGVIGFVNGYDEALAHQLFAGGDVLMMPSRFEPCGLAQMQAMRYGTLPLVTDVGGLHDTVIDADSSPDEATGFVAAEASTESIRDTIRRASAVVGDKKRRTAMQKRGMKIDWSWKSPVAQHLDWYERLIAERG